MWAVPKARAIAAHWGSNWEGKDNEHTVLDPVLAYDDSVDTVRWVNLIKDVADVAGSETQRETSPTRLMNPPTCCRRAEMLL